MKKIFTLTLYCMLVLYLFGCSIDVSQPTIPSSTLTPTTSPDRLATPAIQTTIVPVTWANLNLKGKLVYINSDPLTGAPFTGIQTLDLETGETATIFRAPQGAWIFYVTISPDSKQLVMSYIAPSQPDSASNRALYIMPLDDGTEPPELLITPPTPDDHYVHVEWSPDGKYIYYAHYNYNDRPAGQLDPAYGISRIAYPDGQPEKIADYAFWPRVSSDSSRLVYVSSQPDSGKNELFLANADGSNPQKIAFSGPLIPEIIDAPIFSPDGQSVLFSAPPPTQVYQLNWFEKLMGIEVVKAHDIPSDWWSVPVTGGVPTRLTQLETINLFASFSPDEKHIASLSGEGIFVMDFNGSNLTRLLFDSGNPWYCQMDSIMRSVWLAAM